VVGRSSGKRVGVSLYSTTYFGGFLKFISRIKKIIFSSDEVGGLTSGIEGLAQAVPSHDPPLTAVVPSPSPHLAQVYTPPGAPTQA